jgi:two-component system CheB/CheR fusion protein
MADVAPVMLWMSREDGLCTFFNQTWLDFTGRTQEQEWGVGWAESVHFEDLQRCLDTYVDAFNRREVFEMEYRLQRADGEYRWVLDRGTPRYAPGGVFAGYIGSCTDITDKKRVEAELRSALGKKRELFGTAAHELKSPVAAMRLQLERLRREGAEVFSESQQAIVERMTVSNDRLARLIESVLQLSQAQDGLWAIEPSLFELGPLVESVVNAQRPVAERKGLRLGYVCEATGALRSDQAVVRTIVTHLLSNALKFTDEGSVEVAVRAQASQQSVEIGDSGRGVAPADRARIFEPFQHLEPARNKHTPGIGVGLALSRRLAELVGARIELRARDPRGSVFTLTLPAAAAPRSGSEASGGR